MVTNKVGEGGGGKLRASQEKRRLERQKGAGEVANRMSVHCFAECGGTHTRVQSSLPVNSYRIAIGSQGRGQTTRNAPLGGAVLVDSALSAFGVGKEKKQW